MSKVRTIVAKCAITGFGFTGRSRNSMVVQVKFANGETSACTTSGIATSALLHLCSDRHTRDFAFDIPEEGPVQMRFPTKREARGPRPSSAEAHQVIDDRSPSNKRTDAAIHIAAPAFA